MKTTGIFLILLGVLSIIAGLMKGHLNTSMVFFIILGFYLIHWANQIKEENNKKKKWVDGE